MIISQLNGGLGNQMFQYATGKLTAKKNGVDFFVDPRYLLAFRFNRSWNRAPEILKMNLKHGVASGKDVRRFLFYTGVSYIDMYLKRFGLFEKNVYRISKDSKKVLRIRDGYLLDFLYGDYFKDIFSELRKEFSLKDKSRIKKMLGEVNRCKSVSIHVRRGDLLKIKNGHVLSMDYYKDAVAYLSKKYKNLKFYVFSDDIEWCEKNFGWLDDKVFVKGNFAVEDFELMRNCKYHILANSTLSWWVGYLERSDLVIAPKYFGFVKNDSCHGLILKDWIVVD